MSDSTASFSKDARSSVSTKLHGYGLCFFSLLSLLSLLLSPVPQSTVIRGDSTSPLQYFLNSFQSSGRFLVNQDESVASRSIFLAGIEPTLSVTNGFRMHREERCLLDLRLNFNTISFTLIFNAE